jgi:hypothetical protein
LEDSHWIPPRSHAAGWGFPVVGVRLSGDSLPGHFLVQKPMYDFMQSVCFYAVETKIGVCQQILIELFNMKFHENLCSGYRLITCGQTDRHGETTKPNFANFSYEHKEN